MLVLNLFTRYLTDLKIRGAVLGEARCQEEASAAQFLGFESCMLGELDAPFRCDEYRQLGNLFRLPVRQDMDWLPALRDKVFSALAALDYQELYVPLGVGWHVDHMLAHLVFEPWAEREHLFYYEDAPYCGIPHSVRYRLDELASYPRSPNDRSLMPAQQLRAWWQASRAYANTALMRNLQPWIVRYGAVPVVSAYLYRLMANHRKLANHSFKRRLEPTLVPITNQFERKMDAMAHYQSQFVEFFSSRQDCAATLAAYAGAIQGRTAAVERYWQVRPPAS